MRRASLARFALTAYPAGLRRAGASEMVSTLLDASDDSLIVFSRELLSVISGGLAIRAARAHRVPLSRLLIEALGYGGLTLCAWLATHPSYAAATTTSARLWDIGFYAVLLLYGLGFRRSAGIIGVAALIALRSAGSFSSFDDIWAACQLASFLAMVRLPRLHRSAPQRAAGLLIATAALAVAAVFGGLPLAWYLIAGIGLAALPFNPALTLGISCMLSATAGAFEIQYLLISAEQVLLLLCAPLAVTLAVTARHAALGHSTPAS